MVDMRLDSLVMVAEKRTLGKRTNCWISWINAATLSNQRCVFCERLLLPKCRTNRLKNA